MFGHIIMRLLCAQTLGCLKIIYVPFGTNGKFIIFKCPNTSAYYRRYYFPAMEAAVATALVVFPVI